MKQLLLFLSVACMLACFSCSAPEEKAAPRPDTLLSVSEMQELMTGICQLEARLRVLENEDRDHRDSSLKMYGRQQLDTLLQHHGIGWETWKANFNYYMGRRPLSDTLMNRVSAQLSKDEAVKNEALRKTMDTTEQGLIAPPEAEWGEIILF